MFQAKKILFLYVETPLHAGTGRGLGAVDLPIQRDRTTGYPIIQASSVKGALRAEAYGKITPTMIFWQFSDRKHQMRRNLLERFPAGMLGFCFSRFDPWQECLPG